MGQRNHLVLKQLDEAIKLISKKLSEWCGRSLVFMSRGCNGQASQLILQNTRLEVT